jgi:hypothetical protein
VSPNVLPLKILNWFEIHMSNNSLPLVSILERDIIESDIIETIERDIIERDVLETIERDIIERDILETIERDIIERYT